MLARGRSVARLTVRYRMPLGSASRLSAPSLSGMTIFLGYRAASERAECMRLRTAADTLYSAGPMFMMSRVASLREKSTKGFFINVTVAALKQGRKGPRPTSSMRATAEKRTSDTSMGVATGVPTDRRMKGSPPQRSSTSTRTVAPSTCRFTPTILGATAPREKVSSARRPSILGQISSSWGCSCSFTRTSRAAESMGQTVCSSELSHSTFCHCA
mmetsp:Transcript_15550/g.34348  ORF Transcript_15550/g.34348 Transcript_15550/m.34348 type:complete len:215 (+) Transcript_15550:256-900(+)